MEINKIVIIGAGLMGSGIAYVSAGKGYQVTLVDINLTLIRNSLKH